MGDGRSVDSVSDGQSALEVHFRLVKVLPSCAAGALASAASVPVWIALFLALLLVVGTCRRLLFGGVSGRAKGCSPGVDSVSDDASVLAILLGLFRVMGRRSASVLGVFRSRGIVRRC
jgi:hypothetical protein